MIVLISDVKRNSTIEREIRTYCRKNISKYKQPFKYEFRESLPTTKIGKIDYKKLEQ